MFREEEVVTLLMKLRKSTLKRRNISLLIGCLAGKEAGKRVLRWGHLLHRQTSHCLRISHRPAKGIIQRIWRLMRRKWLCCRISLLMILGTQAAFLIRVTNFCSILTSRMQFKTTNIPTKLDRKQLLRKKFSTKKTCPMTFKVPRVKWRRPSWVSGDNLCSTPAAVRLSAARTEVETSRLNTLNYRSLSLHSRTH